MPSDQFEKLKTLLLKAAKPVMRPSSFDPYDGGLYMLPDGEIFGLRISKQQTAWRNNRCAFKESNLDRKRVEGAPEMTNEPINKRHGIPLSEWIMQIPGELPIDAVGLWQFIPAAEEDFDFDKDQLIDCVRRVLHALIAAGAKPVRSGKGTGHDWIEQTQYGSEPNEIVNKIIAEWAGWGFGEPMAGGLWFALPELLG